MNKMSMYKYTREDKARLIQDTQKFLDMTSALVQKSVELKDEILELFAYTMNLTDLVSEVLNVDYDKWNEIVNTNTSKPKD